MATVVPTRVGDDDVAAAHAESEGTQQRHHEPVSPYVRPLMWLLTCTGIGLARSSACARVGFAAGLSVSLCMCVLGAPACVAYLYVNGCLSLTSLVLGITFLAVVNVAPVCVSWGSARTIVEFAELATSTGAALGKSFYLFLPWSIVVTAATGGVGTVLLLLPQSAVVGQSALYAAARYGGIVCFGLCGFRMAVAVYAAYMVRLAVVSVVEIRVHMMYERLWKYSLGDDDAMSPAEQELRLARDLSRQHRNSITGASALADDGLRNMQSHKHPLPAAAGAAGQEADAVGFGLQLVRPRAFRTLPHTRSMIRRASIIDREFDDTSHLLNPADAHLEATLSGSHSDGLPNTNVAASASHTTIQVCEDSDPGRLLPAQRAASGSNTSVVEQSSQQLDQGSRRPARFFFAEDEPNTSSSPAPLMAGLPVSTPPLTDAVVPATDAGERRLSMSSAVAAVAVARRLSHTIQNRRTSDGTADDTQDKRGRQRRKSLDSGVWHLSTPRVPTASIPQRGARLSVGGPPPGSTGLRPEPPNASGAAPAMKISEARRPASTLDTVDEHQDCLETERLPSTRKKPDSTAVAGSQRQAVVKTADEWIRYSFSGAVPATPLTASELSRVPGSAAVGIASEAAKRVGSREHAGTFAQTPERRVAVVTAGSRDETGVPAPLSPKQARLRSLASDLEHHERYVIDAFRLASMLLQPFVMLLVPVLSLAIVALISFLFLLPMTSEQLQIGSFAIVFALAVLLTFYWLLLAPHLTFADGLQQLSSLTSRMLWDHGPALWIAHLHRHPLAIDIGGVAFTPSLTGRMLWVTFSTLAFILLRFISFPGLKSSR